MPYCGSSRDKICLYDKCELHKTHKKTYTANNKSNNTFNNPFLPMLKVEINMRYEYKDGHPMTHLNNLGRHSHR